MQPPEREVVAAPQPRPEPVVRTVATEPEDRPLAPETDNNAVTQAATASQSEAGAPVPSENPQSADAGGEDKNALKRLWGLFKRDK
jgi:hypothetical protein